MSTTCSVDGCENRRYARTYCGSHYSRWYRHGSPLAGRKMPGASGVAFWSSTEAHGDCLIWTAGKNGNGYGRLWVDGRMAYAHRRAWELAHGEIPDGMVVDHTCHTKLCVKPGHLRLVTPQNNAWNQDGARGNTASGVRNVRRMKNGWQVRITKDGTEHHFGTYPSIETAALVAEAKRTELFGEYAGR